MIASNVSHWISGIQVHRRTARCDRCNGGSLNVDMMTFCKLAAGQPQQRRPLQQFDVPFVGRESIKRPYIVEYQCPQQPPGDPAAEPGR